MNPRHTRPHAGSPVQEAAEKSGRVRNGSRQEAQNESFDVAVVGAGPAGLAAAIRIRFVKAHEALPLSVALFDPGTPGGLLKAGRRRFVTGPSHMTDSSTLLGQLLADVQQFQIPHFRDRVASINAAPDGGFVLELATGRVVLASSVILATGSRPLADEVEHLGDGVFITFKGVSFLKEIVRQALAHASRGKVALVTNRRVRALLPLFAPARDRFVLLVPPHDAADLSDIGMDVLPVEDWSLRKVGATLSLEIRSAAHTVLLDVGAVLLDYVSFQAMPTLPRLDFPVELLESGAPRIDEFLQSSVPGLFLAGDVAGRFATVASALADGITAGFGAYSHAYRGLFGHEPPLFAYRAGSRPESFLDTELPPVTPDSVIQWLQSPPTGHPLSQHDRTPVARIARDTGLSPSEVVALVYQGIRDRMLTVRPGGKR